MKELFELSEGNVVEGKIGRGGLSFEATGREILFVKVCQQLTRGTGPRWKITTA